MIEKIIKGYAERKDERLFYLKNDSCGILNQGDRVIFTNDGFTVNCVSRHEGSNESPQVFVAIHDFCEYMGFYPKPKDVGIDENCIDSLSEIFIVSSSKQEQAEP